MSYSVKENEDGTPLVIRDGEVVGSGEQSEETGEWTFEAVTGAEKYARHAARALNEWANLSAPLEKAKSKKEIKEETQDPEIAKAMEEFDKKEKSMSDTNDMSTLIQRAEEESAARRARELELLEKKKMAEYDQEIINEVRLKASKIFKERSGEIRGVEDAYNQLADGRGDKTPAFIKWCADNLSEAEFLKRYAGRKIDCLKGITW